MPVSHSSFPAYSFLYMGGDATIFYSGDLRFEPLANICRQLDEVIRDVGVDRVDVAMLEGTNFSVEHTPISASTFRDYISLLLREYELISISIDPLDLEAFMSILDLSLVMERSLIIGSERLLWAVNEIERIKPEAPQHYAY